MIDIKSARGNHRNYGRIKDHAKATRRGIRQGWFAFAEDLKREASKQILKKPKGGRTYIVRGPSGRRRRHVASAPGETHANLSGKLRRSLSWKVYGTDSMEFGYGVRGKAAPDYAKFVEFGTSRMAERPSLLNAINATERNAEQHFERAILAELR